MPVPPTEFYCNMADEAALIFVGNIIHCVEPFSVQTLEKGYVIVQGRKIIDIDKATYLDDAKKRLQLKNVKEIYLKDSQILIPGLIDTHIHAPQYPNAGLGYDKPLLDWLNCYTYQLERKYKDAKFAKKVYDSVVRKTLINGTTTASYFAALFDETNIFLVDAAINHGQRALIGKVNMTKLAPPDYVETPEETLANTKRFIETILSRKSHLVKPVITPRFAPCLDMEVMKKLGKLAQEYDVHIQSHISENKDELKLINELFGKSYAEVYDEAGLLTEKTILGHGIYLSESEMKLLSHKGTSISHCPISNTYLQSGLCDVKKMLKNGVTVGLGTDMAGGASPSVVSVMRATTEMSLHLSFVQDKYEALNYCDSFYLATLGGAKALAMDKDIGNFEIGKEFDALLVDMDVANSTADYLLDCTALELLQKFVYLGDDRNILHVYVSGRKVK